MASTPSSHTEFIAQNPSHVGTLSFALLGSSTLAQNQAHQARRENFCCAKLGPCRGVASPLAFGQNLRGLRITRQAKGADIDLIADDEGTIVFIDVTANTTEEGGFQNGKHTRESS